LSTAKKTQITVSVFIDQAIEVSNTPKQQNEKSLLSDRGFSKHLSLIDEIINFTKMKYILFIAMDLALYPFLLVLFIGKCIKEKIQIAH
jgi:hypothetical protein